MPSACTGARPDANSANEDSPASGEATAKAPKARAPKKRKQRSKRSSKRSKWQELDAEGRQRPQFLASFPDEPELNRLADAFEKGNYAYVRENAPKLVEKSQDAAVQRAAMELAARIKPDPLLKYILAMSVLLLVYLVVEAYAH
jgi:hypothetical protein